MNRWWINGQPGAQVDITDRGFNYADGLFETIAIRGAQPRFLSHHLDRLFGGCERLGIAPLMPRSELATALGVAATGVACGVLKLMVSRGSGPRGYAVPPKAAPTIAWGVTATPLPRSLPITLRWCATVVSVNRATAGLKTLGRLEQVLARREWSDPAVAEGLMVDGNGRLVGGTASNIFLVMDGRLLTPALHHAGVAGVMRRVVLEAARHAGIGATEANLRPAQVNEAAEVFVSNALTGIRPVAHLAGKAWEPGPVTRQVRQLLANNGIEECTAPY